MSAVFILANGKHVAAQSGLTVADFLRDRDLAAALVLVEYNGEPLDREAFDRTPLRAGDRLEIAHMVGGG